MSSVSKTLLLATALLVGASANAGVSLKANVQRLAEHVYAIHLLNYNSLVVIGDEDVLITDTANPYRASLLVKEIAKLTDKPVGKIVLSHEHFDHTGGTEQFPQAEIIAQRNILEYQGLDPLNMVPDVIHRTFDKRLSIDMGTTQVELLHQGIADGAAIALVYLPKERVVLTADMYVDDGLNAGVFLTDTNLLGNRKLLNELASWQLNHAINVHSARTDLAPLLATAEFLNDLYDAVLPEVQQMLATNPAQLVPNILKLSQTLALPQYQHWKNYADLPVYVRKMAFAMIHGG